MFRKYTAALFVAICIYMVMLVESPTAQGAVIEDWAYQNHDLTSIDIPEDVTEIGEGAYANNRLRFVAIPSSVTYVGNWAFEHNPLTLVMIEGATTTFGANAFANNPDSLLIVGNAGSAAETYAAERGYHFLTMDRIGEEQGFQYIAHDDETAEIVNYFGVDSDLDLPKELGGFPVTAIRSNAFSGLGLTSIRLPETITFIGNKAFADNDLSRVVIPNAVQSIGSQAFTANALTNVAIPDAVTEIGSWAFERNQLTDIMIGSGMTQIAEGVFADNSLRIVFLPEQIHAVGAWAFERNALEYVISAGEEIGLDGNAFANSSGSITIVGTEGSSAQTFAGDKRLSFLPVKGAFQEDGFQSVTMDGHQASIVRYIGEDVEVTVPEELGALPVTEIWSKAFSGKGLTELSLPDSLLSIGNQAFAFNLLTSVAIPDSLQTLGDWTFERNQLTSVKIGSGLSRIGKGAFAHNQLSWLALPPNIEEVDKWAFQNNLIRELRLSEGIKSIGESAFVNNTLMQLRLPSSLEYIDKWAFMYSPLRTIIVKGEGTEFGTQVFFLSDDDGSEVSMIGGLDSTAASYAQNHGLHFYILNRDGDYLYMEHESSSATIVDYVGTGGGKLNIPENLGGTTVRAIGPSAFAFLSLTEVVIPEQVAVIADRAFEYNSITGLTLGEGLEEIGEGAFLNSALHHVRIPEQVESIGRWAFLYNPLIRVIFEGNVQEIDAETFHVSMEEPAEFMVIGLQGTEAEIHASERGYTFRALQTDGDWTFYEHEPDEALIYKYVGTGGDVHIPGKLNGLEVTEIGEYVFSLKGVTAVTLPDSITEIGEGAFQYNHLEQVVLGERVSKVGRMAFMNNRIIRVWFPDSVRDVGQWAFLYNPLQLMIFEGVNTIIGYETFGVNNGDAMTIVGEWNSTAKTYADEQGFGFYDIATVPQVTFHPDGSSDWRRSPDGSTTLNVQHGVSLYHLWSKESDTPPWEDGASWSEFTSGGTITLPADSGVWYLHVRVVDMLDRVFAFTSQPFRIDNDAPDIVLQVSPDTPTNQAVTVTADVYDRLSGVALLKWAAGEVDEDDFATGGTEFKTSFLANDNGTYTVYVADAAGNRALSHIVIDHISRVGPTLALSVLPVGQTAGNVTVGVDVQAANALADRKYALADVSLAYFADDGMAWSDDQIEVSSNGWLTVYVRDIAGNETLEKLFISNIDRVKPVLTLHGAAVMIIPVGGAYTEPGVAALDDMDGNITNNVTVTGSVYADRIGQYKLQYHVADRAGNAADAVWREVNVVAPDEALALFPTISPSAQTNGQVAVTAVPYAANGVDIVKYDFGKADIAHFTAYGIDWDGSPIIMNDNGWLTLYARDGIGNEIVASIEVTNIDKVKPVIVRHGSATVTVMQGTAYLDPGATATDDVDGDLTDRIQRSGNVDTNVIGEYTIRFNVMDQAGNNAEPAHRKVLVVAEEAPEDPDEPEDPQDPQDPEKPQDPQDEGEPTSPSVTQPSRDQGETQTISEQGGTIEWLGAAIEIPDQAVERAIRIRVVIVDRDQVTVSPSVEIRSDIYEITKDESGAFSSNIRLTLPFEAKPEELEERGQRITLMWLNEETSEWVELEHVEVDWETRKVTGETDHFTKFAVVAVQHEQHMLPDESGIPSDIAGHWAETYILQIIRSGFAAGYPDGRFKPDQPVTRAEFVSLIVRAFQLKLSNEQHFADTAGHWAETAIAAAAARKLVSGYEDGTFRPNAFITREEMAVITVRSLGLTTAGAAFDSGERLFSDDDLISDWSKAAVQAAFGHGIVVGDRDGRFRPKANTTRAEIATVLSRMLSLIETEDGKHSE